MIATFLAWLAMAAFVAAFWFVVSMLIFAALRFLFSVTIERSMDWSVYLAIGAFIGSMLLGGFFSGVGKNNGRVR